MKATDINQLLVQAGIQAMTVQDGVLIALRQLTCAEQKVAALTVELAVLRGDACEIDGADLCGQCLSCLTHEVNALRVDRNAWRDAVTDAAVVDWIYIEDHKDNPRLMVNDLLVWQQKIALDPAVSKEAFDWKSQIDRLSIELAFLKGKYAVGTPFRQLIAAFKRFCTSLLPSRSLQ